MRLRDYFRGYRVVMQSRLRREDLEQRVRATLVPRFRPFTEGVAGWARRGRVSLQYRPRFFGYKMYPVLAGRFSDELGPTRLTLRFRAPIGAYLFFAWWYGALIMMVALLIVQGFPGLDTAGDKALAAFALVFFGLFPLLLHYLGTRRADEHLDRLIQFLEREGEATLIERERRS